MNTLAQTVGAVVAVWLVWALCFAMCSCTTGIYRGVPESYLTKHGVLVLNESDWAFPQQYMEVVLDITAAAYGQTRGERLINLTIRLMPGEFEIAHFEGGMMKTDGVYRCGNNYVRVHLRGNCGEDVTTIVHEVIHFFEDAYTGRCAEVAHGRKHIPAKIWSYPSGICAVARRAAILAVCR